MRHGINITTNQRLSPTFRGNGNTIIVGDSQTSPLTIFPEGGGTSVHRLIVGIKFTVFSLFCFVFEGNFQVQGPGEAYIRRGDLREGFLRYEFEGLIHGGAYFRNFTVYKQNTHLSISILTHHYESVFSILSRGND